MIGLLAALALALGGQGTWTDYDGAEAHLNEAYRALMANIAAPARAMLRNQERAWIAKRNSACGFEAKNRCATKYTIQRTAEIESTLGRDLTYRSLSDAGLLRLEKVMEEECRGGVGQDPDGPVCSRRDAVVNLLNKRGWCWGPDSAESNADRYWMRTGKRCRI